MKNVLIRSISGIVYIALIVGAIFLGWPAFVCLMAVFALFSSVEYSRLANPIDNTGISAFIFALDAMATVSLSLLPALMKLSDFSTSTACICLMISYFLIRTVAALFDKRPLALRDVAKSFLGVIYIGLPLCLLNLIYTASKTAPTLVLLMFVTIWLNDTGAFCFGSTLGRHRLCERLSPKKSWEGFWGGMSCCIVFSLACFYWFNEVGMSLPGWIIASIIISVFATWGDLFESLLKRTLNVKDSGNLIPGHGGILDRIDSLLFVAPALMLYLLLAPSFGLFDFLMP